MTSPALGARERPRILLVEDDPAVRRSLQLLLQSQGYDVRAYPSAVGLANNPEALNSSCLVTDLMMPDLDALGLLSALRASGWAGGAILVSGHLTNEWRELAREQGFDAALAKPIPDAVLTQWVARLVGRMNGAAGGHSRDV